MKVRVPRRHIEYATIPHHPPPLSSHPQHPDPDHTFLVFLPGSGAVPPRQQTTPPPLGCRLRGKVSVSSVRCHPSPGGSGGRGGGGGDGPSPSIPPPSALLFRDSPHPKPKVMVGSCKHIHLARPPPGKRKNPRPLWVRLWAESLKRKWLRVVGRPDPRHRDRQAGAVPGAD